MEINEHDAPQIAKPEGSEAHPRRRRTTRNALVGLVAVGGLVLTAGSALALSNEGDAAEPEDRSCMSREMEAMHGSEEMRRMHAELSPELRAEMDQMHDRMGEMRGMGSMR